MSKVEPMEQRIVREMESFEQHGGAPVDEATLYGAILLADKIEMSQALLNLIHKGELVANPFDDSVDVDDIEWISKCGNN